ncbi:hypothetical protein XENTR_v10000284 [Xenopus tropicalis]|nr:novel C3HC4 type (RING finger) and B-box zinc finger protein with SPRY domain [Xenopus tropicalis]XP_012817716.1 novel C3HC4 type (RING finger) and B-box zinc finger protein with SPRY domain isoform X2 [Xenopus tropicalis]XP_012817740.1 novel C3HC4 type (RING finger) and B-box zinc finger protein with SPRY domain isoform X2 [Xenopus tropicalis]XP_012817767.1 novel C3HC4 type (RING finger) and B-box zinc finger protein with SPRY domain isoform X2 [Xenopus tropicalis]XP_017948479.1 novel C3HC4|eukprot:XP_012817716.1 PREDICTED: novel C3HC4 type (RING finger) and B-box zinc finger protein with SPRY domain isoform X2 [Xenopus tropicalis]
MAAAGVRDELTCSICLNLYTDPIMLPCGHNFCQGCAERLLDSQEESDGYSCPECRAEFQERPELQRNRALGNIAEHFRPNKGEQGGSDICCTYCVCSSVAAAKSCLHCEASLCDTHLRVHSKSAEHVLTEPTTSFMKWKCSLHKQMLEYYCWEDSSCVCVYCWMAEEHRGHSVGSLIEASEKKKKALRNVLLKLSPDRKETDGEAQRLHERRREVEEKAACWIDVITALFRDIKEQLEAVEKRVLNEIYREEEKLFLHLCTLIQQLEIKKDELSRKIGDIEGLCNRQESDFSGAVMEGGHNKHKETNHIQALDSGDVFMDLVSETLLKGLDGIFAVVNERLYGQEATDMLLDISTAGDQVLVSKDRKSAVCTLTDLGRPRTPKRFVYIGQALSTKSFTSGRHYWDMKVSESEDWRVGVVYPSTKRKGKLAVIGNSNKSWCLYRWTEYTRPYKVTYSVKHDGKDIDLPHIRSCRKIRISLDYEAGRLSFYSLSQPIRLLHTFTASFTEPLYAAFLVIEENSFVKIIS